jgi:iron(III) transport system permease protein
MALAFIFFYTRFPLPVYGTIWIIAIAYVTRHMAFSCRLMNAAYLQIAPELEEASAASGAGWLPTIRYVVLPIVWPAFTRGWLMVFVHCLRDVTLALMLFTVDNGTIAIALWQFWMVDGDFGLGAALSVPLLLVSLGITSAMARPAMVQGVREVH